MAKYCTRCGTLVTDNFCAHCGARAPQDEPASTAAPDVRLASDARDEPVAAPAEPELVGSAVPPGSARDPNYGLWLGGVCVFAFFVVLIASVAKRRTNGAADPVAPEASSFVTGDASRRTDSLVVSDLWARKGSLTADERARLDELVHVHAFSFGHDQALHSAVIDMRLDSAEALLKPTSYLPNGFPVSATAMLILRDPVSPAQARRAAALRRRADAAQAASDREITAQTRRSQEDAVFSQAKCSPSRSKVRRLLEQHSGWGNEDLATIACRRIQIGFDHDRVIASWGRPDHVNRTTYSFGVHEQWVYGEYGSGYVYFEDGVVTAIQN
jgi:hypothetical protein